MLIRDAAAATSREVTPEGFLRVRARIGRAGLHDYRAAELGTPEGFAPGDPVRVYRPPEEVFDPASMASFSAKPVTDDHPPEMVDARNWKRYAIGQSGHEVIRDGDHLATDLLISDAAGAQRALAGAELSNGYFADFIFGKGTTPAGEPYDAVQRNIRGNHVALVKAGRCGGACRIDAATGDSCTCGSPDEGGSAARDEAATLAELRRRVEELEREHRQAIEAKDGALAALALQVPDAAALDALVEERGAAVGAARRLIGANFDPSGRSASEIRRLAVTAVLGRDAVADRGDAYVTAAFDTLVLARTDPNPLAVHLAAGLRDAASPRAAALAARDTYLTRAWKGDDQQGAS